MASYLCCQVIVKRNGKMNSEIKNVLMEEMAKMGKESLSSTEILDLLEHNDKLRYAMHGDYCRQMHKQDILDEIEYRNSEENANISIDDDTLEDMLEDYENKLEEDDEWHLHLVNTFRKFEIIE